MNTQRFEHFKIFLQLVQGNLAPPICLDVISAKLCAPTTNAQVKRVLKELGMRQYYEYAQYITNKINDIPKISFTLELETKLCEMFLDVQKPFAMYCKNIGKNISFLSYTYLLHRFLQLLGEEQYASHLVLTRSKEKLKMQDEVFQFICTELGW